MDRFGGCYGYDHYQDHKSTGNRYSESYSENGDNLYNDSSVAGTSGLLNGGLKDDYNFLGNLSQNGNEEKMLALSHVIVDDTSNHMPSGYNIQRPSTDVCIPGYNDSSYPSVHTHSPLSHVQHLSAQTHLNSFNNSYYLPNYSHGGVSNSTENCGNSFLDSTNYNTDFNSHSSQHAESNQPINSDQIYVEQNSQSHMLEQKFNSPVKAQSSFQHNDFESICGMEDWNSETISIHSNPETKSNTIAMEHNRTKEKNLAAEYSIFGTFSMSIPSLSSSSMSAKEILERIEKRANEVETLFIPCVEFLVMCQQELRAGLAHASKRKSSGRGYNRASMTPREFYNTYLTPLPDRFYGLNQLIMSAKPLHVCVEGISSLLKDAKIVENMGCEAIKNSFLGGMRDGESWGLRKWLSKNGGALSICNDLELIYGAIQKLDKNSPITIELAARIRPKTKQAYHQLKNKIPPAYQEVSTAHPYLPFFHRLETALKSLMSYDPEEDDVICIDSDSEDDGIGVTIVDQKKNISKTLNQTKVSVGGDSEISLKDTPESIFKLDGSRTPKDICSSPTKISKYIPFQKAEEDHDDGDSDIEVICVKGANGDVVQTSTYDQLASEELVSQLPQQNNNKKPKKWRCPKCLKQNECTTTNCIVCDSDDDDNDEEAEAAAAAAAATFDQLSSVSKSSSQSKVLTMRDLSDAIDKVATVLESGRSLCKPDLEFHCLNDFWSTPLGNYVFILRLMQMIISERSADHLLNPIYTTKLFKSEIHRYKSLIKNPLCFLDIVKALYFPYKIGSNTVFDDSQRKVHTGQLECSNLKHWNMFIGKHLIEAIDLIFLNALAFNGKCQTTFRKDTTRLRAIFWEEIKKRACYQKQRIPTRRGETSGFVIKK
mmetsp:Transcript_10773/g.15193  ORF Transcript_10773/g.15193 Transcript_10773/m.15193 type:complete len:883 (+) Transcript_10773:133-2781(+)